MAGALVDVRYGSFADITSLDANVRKVPIADLKAQKTCSC